MSVSCGRDRTSQVCALAQIFLDPHYRTMAGFAHLIEKDFLSFGHPFHLRTAHGESREMMNNTASSQTSPIFVQYLDCVWQLVQQYPDYFEFKENFLVEIADHIYSCRFGTFLCDTERDRGKSIFPSALSCTLSIIISLCLKSTGKLARQDLLDLGLFDE